MRTFPQLNKELKQSIGLLSLGTFLENFDLFLYAHMSILLNDLFFPPVDASSQSLLSAFAFCSSFIFRPLGAILLGYLGDTYGSKLTVVITNFMMALTCLIMAHLPTYSQIGITAAWIITLCRVMQGISSIGGIVGAELFLTEVTPLPARFSVVGLVTVFADMGGLFAMAISTLATSFGFNWRIAFWIGAGVAVIGNVARITLRESTEFADARKRLQNVADRTHEDLKNIKNRPFYNQRVDPKTACSYFFLMCPGPAIVYFTYFYSAIILRNTFGYNVHQILVHNLLLGMVQVAGCTILRTYLTTKIHPLKILQFTWMVFFTFIFFMPWLLNACSTIWQFFLVQTFIVLFKVMPFPAVPIILKNFPIFKRFSYASFLNAISSAMVYVITSFGLTYLINYFGYKGVLILMVPMLIGYGYSLNYFKNVEKAAGRYPDLGTLKMT